jgi:hypothetical protein
MIEKDFHDDLLAVFEQVDTRYLVFATDDVVYFDGVDFSLIEETFAQRRDLLGFTLKFGPDYFADGKEPITQEMIGGHPVYKVDWKKARDAAAGYPFELNSTIYPTALVRELLAEISRDRPVLKRVFAPGAPALKLASLFVKRKRILHAVNTFHDPNHLEGYGHLWCRKHRSRLPACLYFQKICATTLQVNRVNTVAPNPVYGGDDHGVEVLNERFRQGYRLDTRYLEANKPAHVRAGQEFFRLCRKEGVQP